MASEGVSGKRSVATAITPDEIRAIRERLGLSQAEAGELLGGGPRAFTKYEAGAVKPAAAVVALLRLLEHDPPTLRRLQASKSLPMTPMPERASPFQVGGEDVARLSEHEWPQLLRRLLHAEAHAYCLPRDGIHVASNVNAPDGGEDGRIEWRGGRENTAFLPGRINQFQLKSGSVAPAIAGRDVLQDGGLKPQIRDVLEAGGHYRMLCGHSYTKKAALSRENSIRKVIRGGGVSINDDQVTFWDADQVAAWANEHPAVSVWVKERTQPGTVGTFRSWMHWAGHSDHIQPCVDDERLPPLRDRLREAAMSPQHVLRIVGLGGIGKSRLVIEGLGPSNDDWAVSDIVLYASEEDTHTKDIRHLVETLAANGTRALVVVNRCCPETHRALAGEVSRSTSRLSLVTLDDEIPTTAVDEATVKIDTASDAIVEAIIDRMVPNLQFNELRRLVHFSEGFPRIAIDVAKAWRSGRPIAHAAEDDIVDAFVLGRLAHDREVTLQAAMLVAAFGVISVDGQLDEVASFRPDLTVDHLRTGIRRLEERGIARRKGRLRVLQPRPIAMRLAERQWREWSERQWERALTGAPPLSATAARVLARLNTTSIAEGVVRHVCCKGPFVGMKELDRSGRAEVLAGLAAVAPAVVLDVLERALNELGDLFQVPANMRRHIVWALEQIVFHAVTFETAADLLLRLAATETENFANSATGVFVGIFRTRLGNTAADGDARLALFDELWGTADVTKKTILVDALTGALNPMVFRVVGAETQGAKPALSSWFPSSREAESKYVTGCIFRLAEIAGESGADPTVLTRASSGLGRELCALLSGGYLDAVEQAARQIAPAIGHWTTAAASLGQFLAYHAESVDPQTAARVRSLFTTLQPDTLNSRLRHLATAMPSDLLFGEKLEADESLRRWEHALQELADDLAEAPETLAKSLPELSQGEKSRVKNFGIVLGKTAGMFPPEKWLEQIERAAIEAPDGDRNLDLLCGYYIGTAKACPDMAAMLKKRMVESPVLARGLPSVCAGLGVVPADIHLAVGALQRRLLPAAQLAVWSWSGALHKLCPAQVAPLLDALMASSDDKALTIALDLTCAYSLDRPESLDRLRPQIRMCAKEYLKKGCPPTDASSAYDFEQLMGWMLRNGREDVDACATALDLAKLLVAGLGHVGADLPTSITCRLLSDFPEIVWPYIGAAIVSDRGQALLMEVVLGNKRGDDTSAVLSLPEAALLAWCHAHPDQAPAFAATVVPVLKVDQDGSMLHPTLRRVVDEFGDRTEVLDAIERNIGTYSWIGPVTGYYERYVDPIGGLTTHRIPTVRRWAQRMADVLRARIEESRDKEAERDATWEI